MPLPPCILDLGRELAKAPAKEPGREGSLFLPSARPTREDAPACPSCLHGRWSNSCADQLWPSAESLGHRSGEVRELPSVAESEAEVSALVPSQIRGVVGSDVAKEAHVVCALEAPNGAVRQRAPRIAATTEGYAQVRHWLLAWGAPAEVLIGLEATGVLWEPLSEAVTQAGYTVLVLNPRQTSSWAASLGLRAKTDGIDAHTLARGRLSGSARASSLPSQTVQALRTLTRTRRDLVQSQTAARQRLQDELVPLFASTGEPLAPPCGPG